MLCNNVIIFGNAHHNTLGLVRSLGEKGIRPILLLEPCDLNFCFVRFSKYIEKIHYLKNVEDGLAVLRNEYWNEIEKPIILNAGDSSICLLDAHYNELKDHFHIFNAKGEQGRINFFMNKANQFPVAERCGLNLIKTWHVKNGGDTLNDITYPCLIKGNNSTTSSKGNMHICSSREELEKKLQNGVDCLVQEYIEKDCELDVVGFSWNHGEHVHLVAAVNKLRETLTRQSDYIRLEDLKEHPSLNPERMKQFVKEIGYEGIFSIELLKKRNKYYFLEMNLRNDGVCWLYTVAGINYPWMWVNYCLGNLIAEKYSALKIKKQLYLMQEDDRYNIWDGKVTLWRWILDFLRTDAYFVLNWHDIKPFMFRTYVHIRQALKKVLKIVHVC